MLALPLALAGCHQYFRPGLDLSYARWLPSGGANVFGVAISLN